ncbi:MAG: glycoside hydrolase family 3 protein, partial [Phycisphaerae bacterium]
MYKTPVKLPVGWRLLVRYGAIGLLLALMLLTSAATAASGRANAGMYSPRGLTAAQINQRAKAILSRLTLAEKLRLMTGNKHEALHSLKAIGLASVRVSDATCGVVDWGPATAFPAASCLTAAWSRRLAWQEGQAIGRDARARQVGILLGPGVNILREPQNGRSMEYIGGEDPTLSASLVTRFVRGLQSQDVAACVKHYVGNEIETQRPWVNCVISRRALEEIYLPPFKAAVQRGHAWAIMTACNRINGWYGSENAFLLNDMLRRHWGFRGVVMTDWGCSYNTLDNLKNGLDLEMPARKMYTLAAVSQLLKQGKITTSLIDQHVRRLLRLLIAMGFIDRQAPAAVPLRGPRRAALVNVIAAEGTVLLKNRGGILPLKHVHTVVLAGPWMTR